MSRTHRIGTVFALLAFVAGGLVAPAVHRVQHGIEHEQVRQEVAAQPDHVHADVAAFTVPLDGIPPGHEPCLLCLPQQHEATPVVAVPVVFAAEQPPSQVRSIAPATAVLALLPIRGPPAVA